MLYRSKIFGVGLKGGMLSTTIVLGLACEALATAPETASPAQSRAAVAPLILSGRQSDRPAGTYSPGVAEIIKMLEAKVDVPVILAYIRNSPIAYDPEAAELVALKEHGASTEMLMALLHRGDKLRLQLAQGPSAVNPPPAAPASDYPPEAGYPAYPAAPYPDSVEAPYPAASCIYASGWPWVYWASACNNYRPYWYQRGCWHPYGSGGHREWLSAISPAVPAPYSVSTSTSGQASALASHSSGGRSAGRLGGRSGGRSR